MDRKENFSQPLEYEKILREAEAILARKVTRRRFLGISRQAAAQIGVLGALSIVGGGVLISREVREDILNSEQQKVKKLLTLAPEKHFVHDIEVIGQEVSGRERAYFRNKPQTPRDKDDFSAGKKIGELAIGEKIARALVVWGNDPRVPMDRKDVDKWLAFEYSGRIVFANQGLFEMTSELLMVEPIDISKTE